MPMYCMCIHLQNFNTIASSTARKLDEHDQRLHNPSSLSSALTFTALSKINATVVHPLVYVGIKISLSVKSGLIQLHVNHI